MLALIRDRPRYGFELINGFEESGLPSVGEGSIYPLLSRMSDAGLVEVYEVRSEETGRKRRYYRITTAGEERLEEWNREWVSFEDKINGILRTQSGS